MNGTWQVNALEPIAINITIILRRLTLQPSIVLISLKIFELVLDKCFFYLFCIKYLF